MYFNYKISNLNIVSQEIKIDGICNLHFYKLGDIKILNVNFEGNNTVEISGSDINVKTLMASEFAPKEKKYLVQFTCPLALVNKQFRIRLFESGRITLGAFPKILAEEIGTFQAGFSFCYY